MTGYLAQLASRSLSHGTGVRPRAATVFESAGLVGHAAAAWLEQAEEHDAEQGWETGPAGDPRPRSGDAAAAGAEPTPLQGPPRARPAAAAAGRPPAAAPDGREPATAAPASRPAKGRASVAAPRAAAAGRRARTAAGDAGSPGGDQPPEAGVPPATPKGPRSLTDDPPAAAGQLLAPAPDPPAEPAGAPLRRGRQRAAAGSMDGPGSASAAFSAPGPSGADPGLLLPVAVQTRRARRAVSTSTGDPPASPPTVHVTIGRVEVRAVAAQAAARPPERERRPALTLAEYLQGREAGR